MPNMAITHHLSQVDVGLNESTITIPHRPDDGEINHLGCQIRHVPAHLSADAAG